MTYYPASQLIARAWNLSGIVARDLEEVSGGQGGDGLFLLNELLDFKACDLDLIPYWKRTVLQLVQGQEMYFIPNLYQIETFTFNIGPVRYPTNDATRDKYFGNGRVDNIQSIPFMKHLERVEGGSNLYVYYLPDNNYIANITGKYALTDVDQNTDLSTVYDGFYISYLRYALANYMCIEWDISFAPDKAKQLQIMEKKLQYISPPDFSMVKTQFFNTRNTALNWAQINIGKGWYV